MPRPDFTLAQAADLARYFLGKEWLVIQSNRQCILSLDDEICTDTSWRGVFRSAGVNLPIRPQFVAKGLRVMMAEKAVCTATANNMAKRIAAALNEHIPDRRGI